MGDDVAVEVESLGQLKNGRTYNLHYHLFPLSMRREKIVAVGEYLDTLHVLEGWGQCS